MTNQLNQLTEEQMQELRDAFETAVLKEHAKRDAICDFLDVIDAAESDEVRTAILHAVNETVASGEWDSEENWESEIQAALQVWQNSK